MTTILAAAAFSAVGLFLVYVIFRRDIKDALQLFKMSWAYRTTRRQIREWPETMERDRV